MLFIINLYLKDIWLNTCWIFSELMKKETTILFRAKKEKCSPADKVEKGVRLSRDGRCNMWPQTPGYHLDNATNSMSDTWWWNSGWLVLSGLALCQVFFFLFFSFLSLVAICHSWKPPDFPSPGPFWTLLSLNIIDIAKETIY